MKFAPYDQIAAEYYDSFHKTCRNFDYASLRALEQIRPRVPDRGLVLDIGCGRGRCVEFLGVDAKRVVQLDNSRAMLELVPREECLLRVLHDAEDLPFLDDQFSCVTSFLCDTFLGLDFLAEAYRVLKSGGLFLATTPAFEWGSAIRHKLSIDPSVTRFKTLTGGELRVPSILVPRNKLVEMLRHVGFPEDGIEVQVRRLPEDAQPISEDVVLAASALKCDLHELELLYLVLATK
jgi:SAM-dependent methyltransferase